MNGELNFKKLVDVELLEKAPEGATAFAEVNGEVKRVAGGIGGGSGGGKGYIWDVTDKVKAINSGDSSVGSINANTALLALTKEEALSVITQSIEANGLTAYVDLSTIGLTGTVILASGTDFIGSLAEGQLLAISALAFGSELVPKVAVMLQGEAATAMIDISIMQFLDLD